MTYSLSSCMDKLIASLAPIERKVLPHLSETTRVSELADKAGVQAVEALRACQFLSNKEVLELVKVTDAQLVLTTRGHKALKEGLPEERFYDAIPKKGLSLKELRKKTKLKGDSFNIAIGTLKQQEAITIDQGVVHKNKKPSFADLKEHQPEEQLLKRGLIEQQETTDYEITLTKKGKQLLKKDLGEAPEERLTSDMLKEGTWKNKQFRHYDVTTRVPTTSYGRKHFVQEAIRHIKNLWVEMGFKEMSGTYTQSAYWDLDALFVPQDHPAREMQDTFYLETQATLPKNWKDIKEVHETGADTGSDGWQYTYSQEEAKKVLLRTHTTVLSAQMLAQLNPETDLPAKYFSVSKVFRNETLDWKHLFEFHQVEGIVVGEGLGLQDLIGLQRQFYKKMGYSDVRFRPSYFPYTEPSCEVEAYHPERKEWVELGGMGVFRPEVVKPLLGKDVPVLAWGLGMERIISAYYNIQDLRDIYNNDLKQLRQRQAYLEEEH